MTPIPCCICNIEHRGRAGGTECVVNLQNKIDQANLQLQSRCTEPKLEGSEYCYERTELQERIEALEAEAKSLRSEVRGMVAAWEKDQKRIKELSTAYLLVEYYYGQGDYLENYPVPSQPDTSWLESYEVDYDKATGEFYVIKKSDKAEVWREQKGVRGCASHQCVLLNIAAL